MIRMPLIEGDIKAACLTEGELAKEISTSIRKVLQEPPGRCLHQGVSVATGRGDRRCQRSEPVQIAAARAVARVAHLRQGTIDESWPDNQHRPLEYVFTVQRN